MNEIEIIQTQKPIEMIIKRDPNMADYSFHYINVSSFQLASSFLKNAFYLE
jgi:hypothetical protein